MKTYRCKPGEAIFDYGPRLARQFGDGSLRPAVFPNAGTPVGVVAQVWAGKNRFDYLPGDERPGGFFFRFVTLATLKKIARAYGMSVAKRDGEYRLSTNGTEAGAYYTTDIIDCFDTMHAELYRNRQPNPYKGKGYGRSQ